VEFRSGPIGPIRHGPKSVYRRARGRPSVRSGPGYGKRLSGARRFSEQERPPLSEASKVKKRSTPSLEDLGLLSGRPPDVEAHLL
jgi:hypothetical protein